MVQLNYAILTIAIPTYNRPQALVYTLEKLLPQLNDKCHLMILDNCSDIPVSVIVENILKKYENVSFELFRNNVNIGGDSNIIRCFEYCKTDWLWTLGDDDDICDNAIKTIFNDIYIHQEALCINYNSPSLERPKRAIAILSNNINEYIQNIDSIGSLIYISCNLYNNTKLRDQIQHASFNTYSCSAQWLVVVFALIAKNHLTIFSNKVICKNNVVPAPFSFVTLNVPKGFSTFLDLPLSAANKNELIRKLDKDSRRWFPIEGVIKGLLILYFNKNSKIDLEFSFKRYYDLLYKNFGLAIKIKYFLIRLILVISPQLLFKLVKFAYKRKTGRNLE